MTQYIDRLGRFVSRAEAVEGSVLKDGYSIRVPLMLADSGPSFNLGDAEQRFADSGEGQAAIAHARMTHDLAHGHDPDAPAFTAADEARAVKAAMAIAQAATDSAPHWKREADRAQAQADAAHAELVARLNTPRP